MRNIVAIRSRIISTWTESVGLAFVWMLGVASVASYCAAQTPANSTAGFKLETTAFRSGGDIPAKYTCDGADVSPALTWTDPPDGTKGFALIVEDPDAPGGTFTHWIVIGIRADARELHEGIDKNSSPIQPWQGGGGGKQNQNDFHRQGYNGPCPPPGKPHRYYFRLYALDSPLTFRGPGNAATRKALEEAIKGHILATAEVMGRYQRK